jgi:hypothetical protein
MAQQILYLLQRRAALNGPRREGVPEVVEAEVLDPGRPERRFPGDLKLFQFRLPNT